MGTAMVGDRVRTLDQTMLFLHATAMSSIHASIALSLTSCLSSPVAMVDLLGWRNMQCDQTAACARASGYTMTYTNTIHDTSEILDRVESQA